MQPFLPKYPRRPPRLTRLHDQMRPFYFITFNTLNRVSLLAHPEIHEAFVTFTRRAEERHIAVGRYVLMPDHIHLFVVLPEADIALTQWVAGLKTVLGKVMLKLGHAKPHWQDGFFDHVLRGHESYSEKWEYVRNNPVRAGLCTEPDDWPFQGEICRIEF